MLRAGRWVDTPLNSRVAYPWFAIIALALVGVLAIIKVEPTVEAAVPQLTRADIPLRLQCAGRAPGARRASLGPHKGGRIMPLREERAVINVKRAMNDAGIQFELKGLERGIEGYAATFQMGMVTHVESQIDERVLEDEPPTPALQALIQRVKAVFGEMT